MFELVLLNGQTGWRGATQLVLGAEVAWLDTDIVPSENDEVHVYGTDGEHRSYLCGTSKVFHYRYPSSDAEPSKAAWLERVEVYAMETKASVRRNKARDGETPAWAKADQIPSADRRTP